MSSTRTSPGSIRIIGVPLDLGAGHRGVDMGPSALRVTGLQRRIEALGHAVADWGDLETDVFETVQYGADERMRHAGPVLAVNARLASLVTETLSEGHFPLVIGGDHSLAIGSLAGSSAFVQAQDEHGAGRVGVIWIDAHADMNTPESTPSGNIHGMSLAISIGRGDPRFTDLGTPGAKVDPHHVAIVGVRDLDPIERDTLREAGVTVFTMREIDEIGMPTVMQQAIGVASDGTAGIHLQFDMDSIDPQTAPGTGTPVPGGLTYREAHLAMELLHDSANVIAADIVETNPALDVRNTTAELATQLVLSLLGKKIYGRSRRV
ncbi:MAG: arginase [Planctomycetes bacterium]|nr:arginase [Planctomycetota bacterium]NOG54266.1 arginase [Planctomycetota bacterium]